MYFANNWHKFNFVITPEEFEAIFNREDFEFVTNNTRVNIDYFLKDEKLLRTKIRWAVNSIRSGQEILDKYLLEQC